MIGCTAALSQSHGSAFDLSLASKSYLKAAKKLYVTVLGGVPQSQKNSYPELYFLQSCACKNEENEDVNMSERMNIGHVSAAAAKVFIEAFLFGVE